MPLKKPVEKDEKATSMRDDFEQAIEDIESDEEGAVTTETKLNQEEIAPDETGEKTETQTAAEKAEAAASGEESGVKESGTPDDDGGKRVTAGEGQDDGDLTKAPESWSPAAREGWKDLPEATRTQIYKREKEIGMALEDGKLHRKAGERITSITDRYAPIIAAEGNLEPLQAIEEMIKVVATLRMGNPEVRAQKIAQFINAYDVPIDLLDNILSGQQPQAKDDPVAKLIDERMGPVNQLLQRINQADQNRATESSNTAVTEVQVFRADKANEFYNDVRMDMADFLDAAKRNNREMSLKQAYDRACAMHPEISKIVAKRTADAALITNKDEIARKKAAGSSIMGKQGGASGGQEDQSLHDTLSELYDQAAG